MSKQRQIFMVTEKTTFAEFKKNLEADVAVLAAPKGFLLVFCAVYPGQTYFYQGLSGSCHYHAFCANTVGLLRVLEAVTARHSLWSALTHWLDWIRCEDFSGSFEANVVERHFGIELPEYFKK